MATLKALNYGGAVKKFIRNTVAHKRDYALV